MCSVYTAQIISIVDTLMASCWSILLAVVAQTALVIGITVTDTDVELSFTTNSIYIREGETNGAICVESTVINSTNVMDPTVDVSLQTGSGTALFGKLRLIDKHFCEKNLSYRCGCSIQSKHDFGFRKNYLHCSISE